MIIDRIENAPRYYTLGARFEVALRALQDLYESELPHLPLHTDIDGKNVFINTSETVCQAPEGGLYETHKNYADIQLVLDGEEYMGYADIEALTPAYAYDMGKDAAFHTGEGAFFRVEKGFFVIFFPNDAHMPCRTDGVHPCTSVKAVAKIKL